MPDDYLEITDLGLICGGDSRVRISRKWPGEGYIFLGHYRPCGRESTPLLVWFRGTEIPREFFAESARTPQTRIVFEDQGPRRQHLTLEYRK